MSFFDAALMDDGLSAGHVARFVVQGAGELDVAEIRAAYSHRDGRSKASDHPELMVRVSVYCSATGVRRMAVPVVKTKTGRQSMSGLGI